MDAGDETELLRKLVFTGHLNVPERRALPAQKARASVMLSVLEEALQAGRPFRAWWMPDDSMVGCSIEYRGDEQGRLFRKYVGMEGERSGVEEYASPRAAAQALLQQIRDLWGGSIDGVPIDWAV